MAVLAIVAGLVWGLLMGVADFGCNLGGSWEKGSSAAPAAAPWLALGAFGVVLWRRSPWALVLAPAPSVLGAALLVADRLEPRVFGLMGCVVGLEGIGPHAPWMAPSLIPSFELGAIVLLVFAVVIPGIGVARLSRVDPDAVDRARELLPSRRVVTWIAALGLAACAVALVVQRLRPLPLDPSFDAHSGSLPREDQLPPPDSSGQLQILNVKLSRLDREGFQALGTLLEQRLGPIVWTSHTTLPDTRYVTAIGHFPPSVWRPPFDARVRQFESCLDALRGDPRDDAFIRDWGDWWSGRVPADEISRRWGAPHDPEDYRRDISEFERGQITAEELERRSAARASRYPDAELYNGLARCEQRNPKTDTEAFSRVVLQWRCAWLQCRWAYIDPDAWARVSRSPCRDTGPRRCAAEAFDYIATGALTVTAPGTPRRTAP